MSDVLTELEVTECDLPPGWGNRTPQQATPRPLAGHWSQRVRDPLGAALQRLQEHRSVLEVLEATAESVQTSSLKSAAPESVAPESVESEDAEMSAAIIPIKPLNSISTAKSYVGLERRRFPRRQSECEVALIGRQETHELTPQETDWLLRPSRQVGRLLDISQTGLCMLLDVDVAVGSEVLLRISNHQLNRHVDNAAKVVRSQPAGHGRVCVHCQVLQDFTLDQLQDLGRPQIANHALA